MFEKIFELLEKKPVWLHLVLTVSWFLITCIIGLFDYYIEGYKFFIFYVLVIIIATLFAGKWDGVASVILSGLLNYFTNVGIAKGQDMTVILFNAFADLIVFFITMFIVVEMRRLFIKERELSRNDYLTGAINKRYFIELLDIEIYRSGRDENPFSFAYFDLDNFKELNDSEGHSTGDEVLKLFVKIIRDNIRKNDLVSRLGGDEFAALFPETESEESGMIINRIRNKFADEMEKRKYSVTLSVGLVTNYKEGLSTDDVFKISDNTMYKAKNNGKNRIERLILKK